ncbi:MAG TPA: glycogen debranching protein GlgX [Gemmataceae bacterium]|nr:glycogen debranching protein GlgX [Gemmataceae bacterium]
MTSNSIPPTLKTSRGRPLPLGVSTAHDGLNFALLCRHGTAVTLVVQQLDGGDAPLTEIALDPRLHRTGDHWHILITGLPHQGFRYGFKVNGPAGDGHRYDPAKILLDPASPLLSDGAVWGAGCEDDKHCTSRRSVYFRGPRYDWGDDTPLLVPQEETIVYELHVRGFTCHPSSAVSKPGTFAGLAEKIPYLKWLGVTAVELLPIHEFDENDCPFINPKTGERNRNLWGYNTIAFAATKASYAASAGAHGQLHEFRDMVQAFHRAGIEVWLDVVFNHTGEGDDRGRTYSFRGLDNNIYYMLTEDGRYQNFTGVGNTMNCNHPIVRDLMMQCLRFWVGDMHVDGLRFDLASIFGRNQKGEVVADPPVIDEIAEDGVLRGTKLVAEPWDAAGLYQVGKFPFGDRWSEWNGRYRDDVRRFWRGDADTVGALCTRLTGSSDLYQWNGRLPRHSVNYVTCHDGFTLWDLVSYNQKHNEENGEGNRDGWDENHSWNCGLEGETTDPAVLGLRIRQAKNIMATLMLSQGLPMMTAGDEFLRTQKGNNNAWCQDNEISWVDWKLAETNKEFLRFVREMIQFRKRHPALRRKDFFKGEFAKPEVAQPPTSGDSGPLKRLGSKTPPLPPSLAGLADLYWHGTEPNAPDFSAESRIIALTIDGRFTGRDDVLPTGRDADIYIAINGDDVATAFLIPGSPQGKRWRRVADTGLPSPDDIVDDEASGKLIAAGSRYPVGAFAVLVLVTE